MTSPWNLRVLLIAMVMTSCLGEQRHATYDSYAALKAEGPGARSWFPGCLPESAVNLEERHDLDSNQAVGRFSIPVADVTSLEKGCEPLRKIEVQELSPEIGRWPSCLTGRVTQDAVQACGFQLLGDSHFILAADAKTGSVFYWSR